MFTRNYYNLLTAAFIAEDEASSTSTPLDYTPPIRIRKADGSYDAATLLAQSIAYDYIDSAPTPNRLRVKAAITGFGKMPADLITTNYSFNTSFNVGIGISLGSNNSAGGYDDYNLKSPITSGLSLSSKTGSTTKTTTVVDDKYISSQHTYFITATADRTVGEVGIWLPYRQDGNICLVCRQTFDEPIVLTTGSTLKVHLNRSAEIYNYTPYA